MLREDWRARRGMMGLPSKYRAVLFVVVLMLLPACISLKRGEVDLAVQKKAEVRLALKASEQDIRKGDFEGALKVYGAALQKYPGDHFILKNYLEAVEYMRDEADDAFDREEFAASGRTYAVLLRNFPRFQEITTDLSFNRKLLHTSLKKCSDLLSKLALTQYRQGNFAGAISLWKNILEFEPGNAGVKQAIYTASAQLKNLQGRTR